MRMGRTTFPQLTRLLLSTAAVITLLAANSASAFFVDFTDPIWIDGSSDPFGTRTRVVNGVEVKITAFKANGDLGKLTFTSWDGGACPANSGLLCGNDGAGIGDDEVSFGVGGKTDVERLLVTFSRPVDVRGLHFLDLYRPNFAPDSSAAEVAQWQINGNGTGDSVAGDQMTTAIGGYRFASVFYEDLDQIEFFADDAGSITSPPNSDFSLAAIGVVPLPGAAWLFGSALFILAGFNSRRGRPRAAQAA